MLIAIDPGTTHSGVVWVRDGVITPRILPNADVLDDIRDWAGASIAIEMIASYGMPVGAEVFETCVWIGRFVQHAGVDRVRRFYRRDIKVHLCGTAKAKDANVRQAILDRYGGKAVAIGNSKQPGPLYGVKSHAWAALAVAVYAHDVQGAEKA